MLASAVVVTSATLRVMVTAQDKDTLWTKVSASGRVVSLTWNKNHPWDAELAGRGAELIARYWTESRREVSEPVGRATASKGERTLRFSLADDLRSNPLGPVCFFIQLPDRRVLPVRRANKQDQETAGFRYETWERHMRQRVDARAAQNRVAAAERALDVAVRNVGTQQSVVSSRGWGTPSSCEDIPAVAADAGKTPYDVVAPSEHDEAARRVCVHRLWYGRSLFQALVKRDIEPNLATGTAAKIRQRLRDLYGIAHVIPEAAGPILGEVRRIGGAPSAARDAQAAEFLADWNRLSATTEEYKPQFGNADDYLMWAPSIYEGAFRIFAPGLLEGMNASSVMQGVPSPTITEMEGVIGAGLDAYFGCLEDGKKQLKIKYDNWQSLSSSAPQRAAAAHEFLVRECRQEFRLLDRLKAERTTFENQLAQEREALKAASAAIPLPTQPQQLNFTACADSDSKKR